MKIVDLAFALSFSVLVGIGMLLQGCAPAQQQIVQDSFTRHEMLYKAAVQVAVVRVLEKNPKLADRVAVIAGQAAADVEAGNTVPLTVLEAQVRARIKWDGLRPDERILVDTLISAVRQELENATKDIKGPEQVMLVVSKVLRWVEQAAAMPLG